MTIKKSVLVALTVLFIFAASASSQTPESTPSPEEEKARKELEAKVLELLDQAVLDGATLQNARNRALVFAMAGEMMFKFDKDRAGELFRRAGNELVVATAESDKEISESSDPFISLFSGDNVRTQVLPMIAKHDADLAYDLLLQTRPAKVAEAIARVGSGSTPESELVGFSMDRQRVQQELTLEQRFAILVAENDPDRAVKLINESLSKGISFSVMPLLQKLHAKSPKKATDLASEVVRKIVDSELMQKPDVMDAAVRFLEFASGPATEKARREKQFTFTDQQTLDLANKLAQTLLQPSNTTRAASTLTRLMPSFENVLPSRAAQLRNRHTEMMNALPPEMRSMQRQQKIWSPNSTPEEIIAELPAMTELERSNAYMMLPQRIAQIEDDSRARSIIDKIPDQKVRDNVLENFEKARITRAAKAGRLEDARRMIGGLAKKQSRIERLVALAIDFHKLGGEDNLKSAVSLMREARAMVNEYPSDEDELAELMMLVNGYAIVDAPEGFRLFTPLVDQINDVVNAYAVLSRYNKRTNGFKKGELLLKTTGYASDGVILFRFIQQIESLGKADLPRMALLAERFQRPDTRTIVKLFLVQGYLRDPKSDDAGATGMGTIYLSN